MISLLEDVVESHFTVDNNNDEENCVKVNKRFLLVDTTRAVCHGCNVLLVLLQWVVAVAVMVMVLAKFVVGKATTTTCKKAQRLATMEKT